MAQYGPKMAHKGFQTAPWTASKCSPTLLGLSAALPVPCPDRFLPEVVFDPLFIGFHAPGGPRRPSYVQLGADTPKTAGLGASWAPLGALSGPSWRPLAASRMTGSAPAARELYLLGVSPPKGGGLGGGRAPDWRPRGGWRISPGGRFRLIIYRVSRTGRSPEDILC